MNDLKIKSKNLGIRYDSCSPDLSEIYNLRIFNQFGQAFWPGISNAKDFNFDEWVKISQGEIEIYPDELFSYCNPKPQVGEKLNKTCLLSFNNISKTFLGRFGEKELKAKCKQQDCKFMNLNPIEGLLTVKVAHFTKYSFRKVFGEEDPKPESDSIINESFSQSDKYIHYSINSEKNQPEIEEQNELETTKKIILKKEEEKLHSLNSSDEQEELQEDVQCMSEADPFEKVSFPHEFDPQFFFKLKQKVHINYEFKENCDTVKYFNLFVFNIL